MSPDLMTWTGSRPGRAASPEPGMRSKLSSALLAADAGVPVLLAAAADAGAALNDASVGTVFAARQTRMSARRFWLRYAAESTGVLTLDDGAVRAVVSQRRSLLPAGITALEGQFHGGDVVELHGTAGDLVARGVVAYDASELATMIGRSTTDLPAELRRPRCTPTIWLLFRDLGHYF